MKSIHFTIFFTICISLFIVACDHSHYVLEPKNKDHNLLEIITPTKEHWVACKEPQPATYKNLDHIHGVTDSVLVKFLCDYKPLDNDSVIVYLYQALPGAAGRLIYAQTNAQGIASFNRVQLAGFDKSKIDYLFFDNTGKIIRKPLK
ncbi:MAG: hypothetical protein WCP57_08095 [Bacteroidota bacterium]